MVYLDKAKARLEELQRVQHIVRPEKIFPCTEEEVRTLEQKVGLTLPAAYREFLLWMGHGAGGLLRGSDCFYWDLLPIQKGAVELMQENAFPEPLPEDAFVFLMHQGYQFDFFRTSEGDDPPVYYYLEKEGPITLVYPHYSEFLLAVIEVEASILKDIAKLHPEKAKADPDFARRVADLEEP